MIGAIGANRSCHLTLSVIQEQASKLNQLIVEGHKHDPAEDVAALILKLAPNGLDYLFFFDIDSTGVSIRERRTAFCRDAIRALWCAQMRRLRLSHFSVSRRSQSKSRNGGPLSRRNPADVSS
ncbi:hypothetical protein IVB16_31555 [Bradyrhizobium sp. 183]|uniref:hypothetical protein n=1 Tax=unclassified Bradyrhizobium TaxID=2631580 RepID=UPI001FFFEFEA|nr:MULTISPECIES: hypothetical protein [unclassified Bradyrhizobium]UPJ79274.1 hypothetical protein IVB17_31555 [Bradyrhizobium sp. 184]UPJ87067.1 hypothetical protein IVB16_31555 [Bradyrhizobium sp. 183]